MKLEPIENSAVNNDGAVGLAQPPQPPEPTQSPPNPMPSEAPVSPPQPQQQAMPSVSHSDWSAPKLDVQMPKSSSEIEFDSDDSDEKQSVPVVKVWSIRGVEYAIMSFMLWAIAIALTWVIVALINGMTGFVELSAPVSLMLVSLPIFAFFFLRLKKAELANSSLKTESTKRKFSQISQIVSFFVIFFSLLGIVASIINAIGGNGEDIGKTIGTAFVFLIVWGGVFAYYWFDEHRMSR